MNKIQFQILFCTLLLISTASTSHAADNFDHGFFTKGEKWDDMQRPVPDISTEEACSMPLEDGNATRGESIKSRKRAHRVHKKVEKPIDPVELKAPLAETERIIPPGETLAEIITEQTKLNPLFIPKRPTARKVYDYRDHIPEKFYQDKKPTQENVHIPKILYQKEYSALLFTAIEKKDIGAISTLLERGADINAKTLDTGFTPLMTAAWYNNDQAASYLIVKGADLNKQNAIGQTALHIAVVRENTNLISLLLRSGARWDILDNNNKKAVDYAYPNLRDRIYLAIAELAPDKNHTLLLMVCTDSLVAVKYLIEHGANIEVRNVNRETPLIVAAKHNNVEMVNLLLSYGAQTGVYDAQGETPLAIARCKNNQTMVNIIETVAIKRELDSGMGTRPKDNPVVEVIKADPVVPVHKVELAPVNTMQPVATNQPPKASVAKPAPVIDTGANPAPSTGFFHSIAKLFSNNKPDTVAVEPKIAENKLPVIEGHHQADSTSKNASLPESHTLTRKIADALHTSTSKLADHQKTSPEVSDKPVKELAQPAVDPEQTHETKQAEASHAAGVPEMKTHHDDAKQQTPTALQKKEAEMSELKAHPEREKSVTAQKEPSKPEASPHAKSNEVSEIEAPAPKAIQKPKSIIPEGLHD